MLEKIEFEIEMSTSPRIVFPFLYTESGLSEWFAEKVTINGDTYSFFFDGEEQKAERVCFIDNTHLKYCWIDNAENTYIEFKIKVDELTNDMVLLVTDFAETSEKDEMKHIWHNQLIKLKQLIGL